MSKRVANKKSPRPRRHWARSGKANPPPKSVRVGYHRVNAAMPWNAGLLNLILGFNLLRSAQRGQKRIHGKPPIR